MSRWASDPDKAADALIARSVDALEFDGRLLLANASPGLPPLLRSRGTAFTRWDRRLPQNGGRAASWPPDGPFDVAIVRLAKARDEQEMTAHATLGALRPGGRLILYGGNDEGIRSAASALEGLCGPTDTLATRGHGRIVAATRPQDADRLRGSLADWRSIARITIAGEERDWVSYPGLFAAGRIDEGTALLLGALPPLAEGGRALDFGCGSGVVAASVLRQSKVRVDMLDSDSVALAAARENVPEGGAILGSSLKDAGTTLYDAILSNPPLHEGVAERHDALERLIAEAPARLRPGGVLQIVVQRRIPLDRLLGEHLGNVAVVAENGRYRVWRGHRTGATHIA